VTKWLDLAFPPQLYDEINYTTFQNASELFFEHNARLTSSIVLKKKVFSHHVFMKLSHILGVLKWHSHPAIEYNEWCINLIENTLKYHMADREMFHAYNSLIMGERKTGIMLAKSRMLLLFYTLI